MESTFSRTPGRRGAVLLLTATVAAYATTTAIAAQYFPTRVPMQISASGHVNRYAPRAEAIFQFIVFPGVLITAVAVAAILLTQLLPVRMLNIPHKAYWIAPERTSTVRAMIAWDLVLIFSMCLIAFGFFAVGLAAQGAKPTPTVALWTTAPFGALVLAIIAYTIWMVVGRYRPRP